MKIIVTADPELPVPPILYGGIERIIDGLIQQYTKDGHTVVLVAKKGSACRHANKKYNWIGKSSRNGFDILVNAIQLAIIYLKEKPDVIHSFSRLLYLYPLFLSTKAKVVQSYQRAISYKSTSIAARISKGRLIFTACAAHMFESLPNKEKWHAVYNFTDTDYFVPDLTAPKNYLFFLGRLEPIKGIKEAIEIAKTTQEDLVIAGNIPREYEQYYTQEIKPQLSDKIRYIGPVNDEQKKNLFHNAKALIFPIQWEEPFGIVMAESLACGVPIIANKRGSVPEVVQHAINGFVCENSAEFVDAVRNISLISAEACRNTALEKFSAAAAAKNYLSLFRTI